MANVNRCAGRTKSTNTAWLTDGYCRRCSGAPKKGTEIAGTLPSLSDYGAAQHFELLHRMVEEKRMSPHHPAYRDALDEMEIRCRERIIEVDNIVYSWNTDEDRLRRWYRKPPERTVKKPVDREWDGAAEPAGKTIYRDPEFEGRLAV